MRLFTAIDLPEDVRGKLEDLLARLRPLAPLKWSSPTNLHVTLKFIGHWPEERLPELSDALGSLPSRGAVPVEVGQLGWFPNPRSPRVFWAGISAPPSLASLARETDEALTPLGIEPEQRPYSPHLTLARIKERVPMANLLQGIAKLPSLEFGRFEADRFSLYASSLNPSGSVYTRLSEFPFGK